VYVFHLPNHVSITFLFTLPIKMLTALSELCIEIRRIKYLIAFIVPSRVCAYVSECDCVCVCVSVRVFLFVRVIKIIDVNITPANHSLGLL